MKRLATMTTGELHMFAAELGQRIDYHTDRSHLDIARSITRELNRVNNELTRRQEKP